MHSFDPFAPLGGAPAKSSAAQKMTIVVPVPANAPAPPAEHFGLGKPSNRWAYTAADGAVLGYVLRFETPDGRKPKEFRQLTLWKGPEGRLKWEWKSWPPKRPLYGLAHLAERPTAQVVVCEGEKSADAAGVLLPDFIVVTSPGGAQSAKQADWSPLRGRTVIVWPDADTVGLDYAKHVAGHASEAGAASISIVPPPAGVKEGWDAADALDEDRWDMAKATTLIAAAKPAEKPLVFSEHALALKFAERNTAGMRYVAKFGKWLIWG